MRQYIGTKIIHAERMPCPKDVHMSKKGDPGYRVVYEDGYKSWSPKDIFEKAYRPTNNMNFGLAIEAAQQGKKIARKGWNGTNIFVALHVPEDDEPMTAPFLYIDTTGLLSYNPHAVHARVPWLASQTDMLADDWFIVEEE